MEPQENDLDKYMTELYHLGIKPLNFIADIMIDPSNDFLRKIHYGIRVLSIDCFRS